MNIWVDADACPGVIKDMLFRVADRTQIMVTLVANRHLRTPPSRNAWTSSTAGVVARLSWFIAQVVSRHTLSRPNACASSS